jgi:hypothetical protein
VVCLDALSLAAAHLNSPDILENCECTRQRPFAVVRITCRADPGRIVTFYIGLAITAQGSRVTGTLPQAAPGCLAAHTAAELRQRTSGTFAGHPLAKILPRRAYRRISPMPYSCLGSAAIVTPGESQ